MTGLGIGPDIDFNDRDLEMPPKTGNIVGGWTSAKDAYLRGPVLGTIDNWHRDLANIFVPGKYMSSDDWGKSEYARKGLSFPEGVSTAVARIAAKDYDDEGKRQEIIANMKDTVGAKASRLLGGIAGFSADPFNLALLAFVPEYVGIKRALLAPEMMAESALSRAAFAAAKGGLEGAAITAPGAFVDAARREGEGEPPHVLSTLYSIGLGAALGGVMHGAFGSRKIITTEATESASQAAGAQMMNDIRPNVNPILKAGYNEALDDFKPKIVDKNVALDDAGNVKQTPEFDEAMKKAYPAIDDIGDNLKAEKFIRDNPTVPNKIDDIKAWLDGMHNPLNDSAISEETATHYEQLLNDVPDDEALPGFDEIEKNVRELSSDGKLSDEEQKTLSKLDAEEDSENVISKALKGFVSCITGVSGG